MDGEGRRQTPLGDSRRTRPSIAEPIWSQDSGKLCPLGACITDFLPQNDARCPPPPSPQDVGILLLYSSFIFLTLPILNLLVPFLCVFIFFLRLFRLLFFFVVYFLQFVSSPFLSPFIPFHFYFPFPFFSSSSPLLFPPHFPSPPLSPSLPFFPISFTFPPIFLPNIPYRPSYSPFLHSLSLSLPYHS